MRVSWPDFCAASTALPAAPRAGFPLLIPTFSPTRFHEEPLKFSTGGVLTVEKQRFYTQLIDATTTSTELAIAFIAFKLGMNDLFLDIRQGLNVSD
jgi:hypothetical protein